jgi:mono/diheme cytochrome c family protein
MSTRMVLSISFALFVVLGMLVYIINDNSRASTTTANTIQSAAILGAELYGPNCSQCHGPKGEGAIGPALDREEWHADNPKYDDSSVTLFLRNVLQRGQYSPQPGIQMPAWSKAYGGPLNDEEIETIIQFITHGSWDEPLKYTAAPNFLADIPANDVMKKQYPATAQAVLLAQNPQKYGGDTPTAEQKKLLAADAKLEDDAKGPIYQEAQRNQEILRKLLGNRNPSNPSENLSGLKQLFQVKGCINCHAIGSAGSTQVGSRRTADWLDEWIKNPAVIPANRRGPNLMPWFEKDNRTEFWPMQLTFMPTIPMTDQERKTIVDYLSGLKITPVILPQSNPQAANQ